MSNTQGELRELQIKVAALDHVAASLAKAFKETQIELAPSIPDFKSTDNIWVLAQSVAIILAAEAAEMAERNKESADILHPYTLAGWHAFASAMGNHLPREIANMKQIFEAGGPGLFTKANTQ